MGTVVKAANQIIALSPDIFVLQDWLIGAAVVAAVFAGILLVRQIRRICTRSDGDTVCTVADAGDRDDAAL